MRRRRMPRPSYASVTATLALFLSLGGASYAVVSLPAHSVGPRQLRGGAVTEQALAFPLAARAFGQQTAIGFAKTPCNSPPPPGSPPPLCPLSLRLEAHRLGAMSLRAPGRIALTAVFELAYEGPAGTSAHVTLGVSAGTGPGPGAQTAAQSVQLAAGVPERVPLQGLVSVPAGTSEVAFTTGAAGYSSYLPGSLVLRSVSVIATALPR